MPSFVPVPRNAKGALNAARNYSVPFRTSRDPEKQTGLRWRCGCWPASGRGPGPSGEPYFPTTLGPNKSPFWVFPPQTGHQSGWSRSTNAQWRGTLVIFDPFLVPIRWPLQPPVMSLQHMQHASPRANGLCTAVGGVAALLRPAPLSVMEAMNGVQNGQHHVQWGHRAVYIRAKCCHTYRPPTPHPSLPTA